MDYKEKYEEALERARAGKPLDEVFPELKESEDERIRQELISFVNKYYGEETKKEVLAYLEKQKEQKPAEWSEDDEQYLLVCKNALSKYQSSDHWDANIISKWLEEKLKSLRPQPHWKPSKEQMECLEDCVNRARETHNSSTSGYDAYHTLSSLYNDIQKLLSL